MIQKAIDDYKKGRLKPSFLRGLFTKKPSLRVLEDYIHANNPDLTQHAITTLASDIRREIIKLHKPVAQPQPAKPIEAPKPAVPKPAPPIAEKKPMPEKAPATIRRTVIQATVEQILGDAQAGKFKPSSLKGKRLVNDLISYFKKTYPYQYTKVLSKEEFRAALKAAVPRIPSVLKQAILAAAPVPAKPREVMAQKLLPAEAGKPMPIPRELALIKWKPLAEDMMRDLKGRPVSVESIKILVKSRESFKALSPEQVDLISRRLLNQIKYLPAETGKPMPIPKELPLVSAGKRERIIRPVRPVIKPRLVKMTLDAVTTRLVSDYQAGYFKPLSLGTKSLVREIKKYFGIAYPLVSVSGKNFKTAAINFKEIASVLPKPMLPAEARQMPRPILLTPERRSELVGVGDEVVRSLRVAFRRPVLRAGRLARAETFSKEEINRVVRGVLEKRGLTGTLSKEEFGFVSDYAVKRPKGKGWMPRPPVKEKFRYAEWLEKSLAETLESEAIERKWTAEQKRLAEESKNVLAELEREGLLEKYLITGKLKYPLPKEAMFVLDRALYGYLERVGDNILPLMVRSPKFGGKIPQFSGQAPKPGGKEFSEEELKGFVRIGLKRQGLKGILKRDYFEYIVKYLAKKTAPLPPEEVLGTVLTARELARANEDLKRKAEAFKKISLKPGVSKEELESARESYKKASEAFKEMRARIAAKAPKVGATKEAREAYAKAAKAFEEQLKIKAEREKKQEEVKKPVPEKEKLKARAKPEEKKVGLLGLLKKLGSLPLAGLGAMGAGFAIALAIGMASSSIARGIKAPVEVVPQAPVIVYETVSAVPSILFNNPALMMLIIVGAILFLFSRKKEE